MPILNQDINMLLSSPHPPWEVVRTHVVLLRLNWTPQSTKVLSQFFHLSVKVPRKPSVSEVMVLVANRKI